MSDSETHHHHHHHKDKRWYHDLTFLGVLWWLIAIAAFIMFIVILVNQSNQASSMALMRAHMNGLSTQSRGPPGRTVAVQPQLDPEASVITRLWERQMYYTTRGTANDTLHKLKETIDVLTTEPFSTYYHYDLSVELEIELGDGVLRKLSTAARELGRIDTDVQYMSFTYNITTNYPYFSTVELQELEFNAHDATWVNQRQITMCSNTASVSTRRCDRHGDEKIVTIHNKKVRPVTPTVRTGPPGKKQPETGVRTAPPKPRTQSADSDDEIFDLIEMVDNSPTRTDAQKAQLTGRRLYNAVFYRQAAADRIYQMGSGAGNRGREEKVLTLELNP